jgi:hypothetical protein
MFDLERLKKNTIGICFFLTGVFFYFILSNFDFFKKIGSGFFSFFSIHFLAQIFFIFYGYTAKYSISFSFFCAFIVASFSQRAKIKNNISMFFIFLFPIFVSLMDIVFLFKKEGYFLRGGIIGSIIFNFISKKFYGKEKLFLFLLGTIFFVFIFQYDGIKNILKKIYWFFEKIKFISFLFYIKEIIAAWILFFFPFLKKASLKSNYCISQMLLDSIKDDIEHLEEFYCIENLNASINNGYIPVYKFFPSKMLKEKNDDIFSEIDRDNFLKTCKSLDLDIEYVKSLNGPFINTIIARPGKNLRISQLRLMEEDFARNYGKMDLRIIYPLKEDPFCIGFEFKNDKNKLISFFDYSHDINFINNNGDISVLFSVDTKGNPYIFDITKAPHVLIAGATGSGKSSIVHSCIISILWKYSPKNVSLVLIDPKYVEYGYYENIPHLILPIARSIDEIENALNYCIEKMKERYKILSEKKVKNIKEFFEKFPEENISMSYIVVFIDEYADMIMQKKSLEDNVIRLAQMARAAGIHIVLSTQRPSIDVVTGTLKANFPTRIACKVSSGVDSRVIIGVDGAEKLLGCGDMLIFNNNGLIERLHGIYIDLETMEKVINKAIDIKKENNEITL